MEESWVHRFRNGRSGATSQVCSSWESANLQKLQIKSKFNSSKKAAQKLLFSAVLQNMILCDFFLVEAEEGDGEPPAASTEGAVVAA